MLFIIFSNSKAYTFSYVKKLFKNESGFTVIEGLLIIFVLGVVGFGGYYLYRTQHKAKIPA